MRTRAEKSSTVTSSAVVQRARSAFVARSSAGTFFSPSRAHVAAGVQCKMTVNQPGDKFEQEADKMADKVMRMPTPAAVKDDGLQRQPEEKLQKREEEKIFKAAQSEEKGLQRREEEKIMKAAAPEEKVQKAEDDKLRRTPAEGGGTPAVHSDVQSAISNKTTGGEPLSADVRSHMEPRFNAGFGGVRIHKDSESAALNNQLSARAFTYQNHIFFSREQYQPGSSEGKHLLAHELTHTIQQGHAVQRSPQVSSTPATPTVQRFGIQDALDKFAEWAYAIPGFRLLTFVLGFNPINMRSTDRNAANLLRALIELLPGGSFITQALDNHGVINKATAWVEQKIAILGDIGGEIVAGLKRFVDSLSWKDIFDLGGVWDRAKAIFTAPIKRLISFGASVAIEILKMVKDAILKPLSAMAQGTRGYDLLRVILGEDPITGEPVPRTAENLLGAFMKFIGQEEIWENIKKGNAIARAYAWFQGAMEGLMAMVRAVPKKIIETLSSLTFQDIITIVGAFSKIAGAFLNIAVDFLSWGLKQVLSLLEIIFSVVAPGVMPYIKKAQAAFATIIKDPIAFVGHLVAAGKQGFQMFASNIVEHLKTALIKWLVGPLADAGVYIPTSFSLIEIVKLVLSVLGLTWANIRTKLLKIIPEPVLAALEKTAGILVTLVKDGPAAAWEQIKAELSELKDQLIAQVIQMVTTEVVKAAVMKLVSMLNPAGAVIQAIIAIYNTVSFFIQKIQQIAAVVASFIDSISAIAAGQVANAAKKVEQTLANTLTVVIAFLAKFAGLGNIPEKIVGIVKKIRQPIDKGLDKIVAWLGKMLDKAKGALKAGANKLFAWWKKKVPINGGDEAHSLYFEGEEDAAEPTVASSPRRLENFVSDARANSEITGNDKKKAALDKVDAEVPVLRKIRADLRPLKDAAEDKRKPYLDKLDASFAKIGAELGTILAGSKGGTESTPIPIPWPKPAYMNYPKLLLFNQGSTDKPKWKLSAKDRPGNLAATYRADGGHRAPSGTPADLRSLGIKAPFRLTSGMTIGPLSEASTPGGGSINSILEHYGWDATAEYMDGDHVVEIQFGGKDQLANLWPLDASMNRGAGSRLSKQQVELDGQKITIDWLKKAKKKPGEESKKYYFKVSGVV